MVNKERSATAGLFTAPSFFPQPWTPRRERHVLGAILLVYLLITIALLLRHEVSHDEAQAWLIARDAPDIGALLQQMRYEGSGALWHLLLRPFARCGASFYWVYALNLLCCTAAVALLLFRAPLPLILRLLLPFTYLFLWEYSVFARSYALGVLLFFSAIEAWRTNPQRSWLWALLLFLCANCNLPSMILAGGFALTILIERRDIPTLAGLMVLAAGLALSIWYVLPADDASVFLQPAFRPDRFTRPLSGLPRFGFICYLFLVALLTFNSRERAVVAGFLAMQVVLLIFFSLVPLCDTRHYLFLVVSMLWLLWLGEVQWRGILVCTLFALMLSMAVRGIKWSVAEWRVHKRIPQEAAAWLRAQGAPEKLFIACDPPSSTVAMAAFLPAQRFYFLRTQHWGTFVTWEINLVFNKADLSSLTGLLAGHPGHDRYFYISSQALPVHEASQNSIVLLREFHQGTNAPVARDAAELYIYGIR